MNGIEQTRTLVKLNRKRLLSVIIIISLCFSLLNIILNNNGLNSIGLASLVVLNFLSSLYFAYHLKTNQQKLNIPAFMQYIKDNLACIGKIALLQVISLLGLLFIIKLLSSNPYTFAFTQVVAIILYVILNCINFQLLFVSYAKQLVLGKCIANSLTTLRKNLKTVLYLMIKVVAIILLGGIFVYLLNIFVYAPQIDYVLMTSEVIDSSVLDPFFSSTLSNFIQSFGAQFIAGICLIWIGIANYKH